MTKAEVLGDLRDVRDYLDSASRVIDHLIADGGNHEVIPTLHRAIRSALRQVVSVVGDPEVRKCEVCGEAISLETQAIAASRGQMALYCGVRCRRTAEKRRQREQTSLRAGS